MAESERVPLAQVRDLIAIDTPLPFRVLDADGRLLLNQGQEVASERQFEQLLERGAWVERPRVEEVRRARSEGGTGGALLSTQRRLTLFDRWERAVWDLDDLLKQLAKARLEAPGLVDFAAAIEALTARDADIALFRCIRQDDRRFALYSLVHGLHCAVLVQLASQQLGWEAARTSSLVGAALTMNVAMTELQTTLAEQKDPPTSRQLQQIRAHPHAAAQLLRDAGLADPLWLGAVEDHHERSGGGGYPRALTEVSEGAQLLRLVDVYMAKVSPRASRAAMAPQQAARELFQQQGASPLAMAVIRTVGAHPPGALVQLASGEIGVVSRRPQTGTAPVVATLTNRKGEPVVDTHQRDTADPAFAVSTALAKPPAGLPRVLPERVYGMVLA
jgi:HD-GYP domain-containing protein (c-di-GMP phosphodiesterase class II)